MYLNRWKLYFYPEKDIPSKVPIWVKSPHIPLHYWSDEFLASIRNSLGHYIDKFVLKSPLFSYACIYVEVELDKGIHEVVNLVMDSRIHKHKVYYDQLLFKCKKCHEYGNFSKSCPKKP